MSAIARGIEWLDAQDPLWRQKVNPETLNIRLWGKCVLGQVFGLSRLPKYPEDLENYGFFAADEEQNKRLTEEWRKEVNRGH